MARRRVRGSGATAARLREGYAAIRTELGVGEPYPPAAVAEAERAAGTPHPYERVDARDLPLLTLDPAGSRDLDQALAIERRGEGHRVSYAIADVAAFVEPGGALDLVTHERVETLYSPDQRDPLHPFVLSEGAASLLPGQDRPAVLWTIDLDSAGEVESVRVERALVRSRSQEDYDTAGRLVDAGDPPDWLVRLREVGERRIALADARGAVDVRVPDQEVEPEDGTFRLVFRTPSAVESWNAQLSLLTGMCAARIMLDGGVGILRTMPDPSPDDVEAVRRAARGLHVDWPDGMSYADLIRSLDPAPARHAAFLEAATTLLRGAGYTAFDGEPPARATHSAVAAPYAHVTAPLRRLVDRYATETALACQAGVPVPDWVIAALPSLPKTMARGDQLARGLDNACLDFTEAVLLEPRVGEIFDAVVVQRRDDYSTVVLRDPPARIRAHGRGLELGRTVRLRLTAADPSTRSVSFVPA